MTYKISRINRVGEEGDFCDTMPTYPGNVTKMAILLRVKITSLGLTSDAFESHQIQLRWKFKMFWFVKIVLGIGLQSSSFSQLDHLCFWPFEG